MDDYNLCREDDDYVRERVRWVVDLSDGTTVYQDDDRPGVTPTSAWPRLKAYCDEQGVSIIRMRLQFRTNVIALPANAPGYFFVKTANIAIGGDSVNIRGYRVGILAGTDIYVTHYVVPELEVLDKDVRPLAGSEEMVIINYGENPSE